MPKEIERVMIPYSQIVIGEEFNSRKTMRNIEELAASIDRQGLLQPMVVREGGPSKTDGSRKYFLIIGERRYRAIGLLRENALKDQKTSKASWNQVEVKLVKADALKTALANVSENLHREPPEPLEEAQTFAKIMEENKLSQSQLAAAVNKSEPYVSQRLSLLKTSPEVKKALDKGTITATHARELVTLPASKQKEVIEEIAEKQAKGEKVSVTDVKNLADGHKEELGIKREKAPRKKSNQPDVDAEKVSLTDEIYEKLEMPSKSFLKEQLGILLSRLKNPQISEATKAATKAQIVFGEVLIGARESL